MGKKSGLLGAVGAIVSVFNPLAGAIIGGIGSVVGQQQQQKAQDKQEKGQERMAQERRNQYAAEQQKAEIQNVRAIRQQIRQQRAAAGSIIAQGANAGTLGSTGVTGGVASTQSQMRSNLRYMSDIADTQSAYAAASMRYGDAAAAFGQAQGDEARGAAFGNLGASVFNQFGGFQTIFGGNQGPSENASNMPAYKPTTNWLGSGQQLGE